MRIVLLVLLAITAFLLTGSYQPNTIKESNTHTPDVRGVCWVAGDSIAQHNIDQVLDIGVNWISQTPFGWMSAHDSPEVVLNNTRAWWGERDDGLIHTARLAHAKGVKTMLKPHIWLRGRDGKWRSDIEMKSEEDWDLWFDSYERFIVHYARLAEEAEMEALCIGTELYRTTVPFPDRWRKIIREIRKVYSGQVTYAANWYKEFEGIEFWDELDYIGVQAYFPLTNKENPAVNDLVQSWKKHKKKLSKVSRKYGKKIVFTEVGYKNTADSASEPWTWPQQLDADQIVISDNTQLNCYKAMFDALWNEPWFDGLFIWKWFHSTYKHEDHVTFFREREERYRKRYASSERPIRPRVYFTPQHTVSLEELSKRYLDR